VQIKRKLRRTWPAFFSRFGRLLPIQVLAIPRLLEGRNVILSAPTATGKTEAALAPLLERLFPLPAEPSLGVLYVTPTRALVNDIDRRIRGPCRDLGIELAVRTGERRELHLRRPPHLLLTTPESLDSMLCRAPEVFSRLRAVILDEIHLMDGGYRGDQLRVLLRRLEWRLGRAVQVAALSATLADPESTAARYMKQPVVCRTGLPRPLELRLAEDLPDAVRLLRRARRHKVLMFCNSRKRVEETAQQLVAERLWPRDALFVHHGSLSRAQREQTEKAFRSREWGLCVATMTLELGIDIGDVNGVVLYGLPPTAAAFQQRIGRACRQARSIFAVGVPLGDAEKSIFRQYAIMARQGAVETTEYRPDASVCVQQLFSLLFAHPHGLERRTVEELLAPLLEGLPAGFLAKLLDHLESEEWIEQGPRIRATTALMDMAERGTIHSNIPDSGELTVIDAQSGRPITTAWLQVAQGSAVALAGRCWRVVRVSGRKAYVQPLPTAMLTAKFAPREDRGAFASYLPPEEAS
jgi:ATP-dependent Lhr-like helicase